MLQSNMSLMPFSIHSKLFKIQHRKDTKSFSHLYEKRQKKFQNHQIFFETWAKIYSERECKVRKIFGWVESFTRLAEIGITPRPTKPIVHRA